MVPNFRSLDYLEYGNKTQRRAHALLSSYHIMEQLLTYGPILTGTIPLEIDIENSDLDIVCCYSSDEDFYSDLIKRFANHSGFKVRRTVMGEHQTVICNFTLEEFPIEIFGQSRPSTEQEAYLHMVNEYQVLQSRGSEFRDEIIRLKKSGLKTEPAFAKALGLTGDPYEAMLRFS